MTAVALAEINPQTRGNARFVAALLLLTAVLAWIRLAGPSDLMDNEQQRQVAYVMDALQNGHWIIQKDGAGEIVSKPPLYAWLAAATTVCFAHINRLSVCLPAILATAGTAWLIFAAGAGVDRLGNFYAALIYLISGPAIRQVGMSRMDAILPLLTAWGAFAGYRAWVSGRGWAWFWLAGAASMLTKGPIGLVLSAGGLLAAFWERPRIRGRWLSTSLILIAITLGWFAASCAEMGRIPVWNKLIHEELLTQAVQRSGGTMPFSQPYLAPGMFLELFVPWSFLTCLGIWRVFAYPSQDVERRRFEYYVAFWFITGILIFVAAPHFRGDLLLPLYPAAALLAGWEAQRLLDRAGPSARYAVAGIVVAGGLSYAAVQYDVSYRNKSEVQQTLSAQRLAKDVEQAGGRDFPLTHIDDPFAINFYLDTMRPLAYGASKATTGLRDTSLGATYDYPFAARLLRGDAAVFLVVSRKGDFSKYLGDDEPHVLADEWAGSHHLYILSNRDRLAQEDHMALAVGPILVETRGLRWRRATANQFTFDVASSSARAIVTNEGGPECDVRVRFIQNGRESMQTHQLKIGESWTCKP